MSDDLQIFLKNGLVQKGAIVKSIRGQNIEGWRLTLKGAAFIYAFSEDKAVIIETVKKIEDQDEFYLIFKRFISSLSDKAGLKLIRHVGQAQLSYGEQLWQEVNWTQILLSLRKDLSSSEMREIRRVIRNTPILRQNVIDTIDNAKREFLEEKDD